MPRLGARARRARVRGGVLRGAIVVAPRRVDAPRGILAWRAKKVRARGQQHASLRALDPLQELQRADCARRSEGTSLSLPETTSVAPARSSTLLARFASSLFSTCTEINTPPSLILPA